MSRFLSVWTGTPFPLDIVSSDSMSPALEEGDIVAWTPVNMDDIGVGDVVVFKSYIRWPDEKLIVHRVVKIRTGTNGQKMLETKGDNNKWIDQAGPHIPEPYIREDHLMGKAVSIGDQPLKIPFIGQFAIWLNEGLDILSQPSQNKGTMSYAGIFSPLVISIVILVLLIFILPEKTKNIREKIRFYIFGPKPLGLAKTFLTFLVAYMLFFTIIHCFAFDSTTASVGVNAGSTDSNLDFGRIKPGYDSFPRNLPVINPGIFPLKGVVYSKGDMEQFLPKSTFILDKAETKEITFRASASNITQNGTYYGEIMIYSSPFWTMFPDEFMLDVCKWNPEATVFILDFISAVILTTITAVLFAVITYIYDKYIIISTELSWHHVYTMIISQERLKKIKKAKKYIKAQIGKKIIWIFKENLAPDENQKKIDYSKPILASLVIIPILFLITDQILAMIISGLTAGFIAYCISCKIRKKIILASILTMTIATTLMMYNSHMMIISRQYSFLEQLSLTFSAMGIYLLVLGALLIPLTLISWAITNLIRNVKERKNPLLVLEGECDL